MTTILDLPVHPFAVHVPIVLVPLLVLFGLVYLFAPPLRRRIGWVVGALALVAPAAVYGAIWSGEQLADFKYPGGWPEVVNEHQDFGWRLLWILVGLVPVWFLFAALERGRRSAISRGDGAAPTAVMDGEEAPAPSGDDPAAAGRKVFMIVIGVIAFALLGLAAWMVFNSGDSGASMVWDATMGN